MLAELHDLMPGILNQMGADNINNLRRLAQQIPGEGGVPRTQIDEDDEDDDDGMFSDACLAHIVMSVHIGLKLEVPKLFSVCASGAASEAQLTPHKA